MFESDSQHGLRVHIGSFLCQCWQFIFFLTNSRAKQDQDSSRLPRTQRNKQPSCESSCAKTLPISACHLEKACKDAEWRPCMGEGEVTALIFLY